MINLNKLSLTFFAAGLGLFALTSCEGGELYNVSCPDWVSDRINEIAADKENNSGGDDEIPGLNEDVYTVGATDYSSGWWAEFSKDYPIDEGEVWITQFNLNINPSASNTYKNFALIVTNDAHRGDADYKEYGACRYDHQPSGNSEWGDLYFEAHRGDVESNLTFETDTDPGVDKLGGKVTLTIDRSVPNAFSIKITNGKVTKTMNIKEALPNFNEDPDNKKIRAFICVEGSYINFIGSTLEPIGGYTSKEDKQPLSMTLKGVPGKVLQGTSLKDAFANVKAVIQFEQEVSAEVSFDDLSFAVIPDMNSLGTKTLVASYAKTFKGEAAEKPVIGTATFAIVDKLYTTIGDQGCTTGWWGAHSEPIKVAPGETQVSTFTNYTSGATNWNNWVAVLTDEAGNEYAVVRADNYGWRGADNTAANLDVLGWTLSGPQADWATWLAAMNGAKCTAFVTNNGDGTGEIKVVMNGIDGEEYVQEYGNIAIDSEDFYYHFTVDGSCLVFDDVLGEENNTTGWWGAHSQKINVPSGHKVTQTFVNYAGGSNWNNFVVVLTGEADNEYAVVRADNYGWRGADNTAEKLDVLGWELSGGQEDWVTWLAAMDGAKVSVTVENVGDGTANISAVMNGTDGEEYIQYYNNITVDDVEDVWFHFTVDNCHLLFDNN